MSLKSNMGLVVAWAVTSCAGPSLSPRGALVHLTDHPPENGACEALEAVKVNMPCRRNPLSNCRDNANVALRNAAANQGANHVRVVQTETLGDALKISGYGYRCAGQSDPWAVPKEPEDVFIATALLHTNDCTELASDLVVPVRRSGRRRATVSLQKDAWSRGANMVRIYGYQKKTKEMRAAALFCDPRKTITDVGPGRLDHMVTRPLKGPVRVTVQTFEGLKAPASLANQVQEAVGRSLVQAGATVVDAKSNTDTRAAAAAAQSLDVEIRDYGIRADLKPEDGAYLWRGCVKLHARVVGAGPQARTKTIESCAPEAGGPAPDLGTLHEASKSALGAVMEFAARTFAGIPDPPPASVAQQERPRPRLARRRAIRSVPWQVRAPGSVLVMPLRPKGDVDQDVAALVTNILLSNLDEVRGWRTISIQDVEATLQAERQKDLLACASTVCLAEIGGALGADLLVYGEVGSLGSKLAVNVSVLDNRTYKVSARSSKLCDREEGLVEAVVGAVDDLVIRMNRDGQS